MTTKKTFGSLLREQMDLLGITPTMLSEALEGVSVGAISNYTNDVRKPRGGRLSAILDLLEINGAHRLEAYELADEPVPSAS